MMSAIIAMFTFMFVAFVFVVAWTLKIAIAILAFPLGLLEKSQKRRRNEEEDI